MGKITCKNLTFIKRHAIIFIKLQQNIIYRKEENSNMQKRIKKVLKQTMMFLFVLTMFLGVSTYVLAASDSTRNNSGSSYTRWVGPAKKCTYSFAINGNYYAGTKKNTVDYKDPFLAHEGLVMYLRYGQSKSGTYYNGSSSAYHRGYVQHGYVKISA